MALYSKDSKEEYIPADLSFLKIAFVLPPHAF